MGPRAVAVVGLVHDETGLRVDGMTWPPPQTTTARVPSGL